jgi:hypothetical protein
MTTAAGVGLVPHLAAVAAGARPAATVVEAVTAPAIAAEILTFDLKP